MIAVESGQYSAVYRSIGHPLVARLGGLFVNRTDNSAVESAVSVKVAEDCRRHQTYLEVDVFAAPATRAYTVRWSTTVL